MLWMLTADLDHAARVDASMLTDHQRMELFLTPDDFELAHSSFGGDEDDSCTWTGVSCHKDSGAIHSIDWHSASIELTGSTNFQHIPSDLIAMNMYEQNLRGEVDTSALPRTMVSLCLQECKFTGTLNLEDLPPKMVSFQCVSNRITGISIICNLPPSLCFLDINERNVTQRFIRIEAMPRNSLTIDLTQCGIDKVTCENKEDIARVILSKDTRERMSDY